MSSSITETAVQVVMPQMGVSVADGTVVEWRKQVGDEVEADDVLCDVTTDKIDVEIPAPSAGVLARVLVEEGETVEVGSVLAELEAGGRRVEAGSESEGSNREPTTDDDNPTSNLQPPTSSEIDRSQFISPIVRRIADEHGIDLSRVEGHGVGGRIRKADLLATMSKGNGHRMLHSDSPYKPEPAPEAAAPAAADPLAGPSHREPLGTMRQAIAKHMLRSLEISAHCTTIVEADFSTVAARRREATERPVRPTYLAFVARAVVSALGRHPVLNTSIDGDEPFTTTTSTSGSRSPSRTAWSCR